jgi:hypothetical protein
MTSDWQPIETAPKDGRWILTYDPRLKWTGAAQHREAHYAVVAWSGSGWFAEGSDDDLSKAPPFWQPLPEPPKPA